MPIEFKLPELGENISGGDVVNVLVREGDTIAANDGVVELETDKAVVEIPCAIAGKIANILVKKGDKVKVGQPLVAVETEEEATVQQQQQQPSPSPSETPKFPAETKVDATQPSPPAPLPKGEGSNEIIPAGPATRRIARELGVELQTVSGSGQHGRITLDDVKNAAGKPTPAPRETVASPGEPGRDNWGPIRREGMAKIRRVIAAQMVKSATVIPHVTNFDDADITDLDHLRRNVPAGFLGEGVKLTSLPFVLRAVALSLAKHPTLNASLDDEREEIVYKQYVNVGVAVDTPRGLVVPVLRSVDGLSIPQIAQQLAVVTQKARDASFAIEDIRGGTFTISNLGAVGGTYSTPIINHPEVAILLLGRARPVLKQAGEKIENRLMLPLSLSYDHRLVDGAAAGRFLNDVIDYLQNPGKLLLVL
jgi:pyruvate/2-oxoglutarate dehydrogenase complex dihydrolipoamide acyltransferase (E2) component